MERVSRWVYSLLLQPRVTDADARLLLRAAGVFRWAVIAMVGMNAVFVQPPPLRGLIVPWMAATGLYAAVLPAASEHMPRGGPAHMARALVLADVLSLLALLTLYGGGLPDDLYAATALLLLEAALVGGRGGVAAIGAILVLVQWPLNLFCAYFHYGGMGWMRMAMEASLVTLLMSALFMSRPMLSQGVERAATSRVPEAPVPLGDDVVTSVHLTDREREVLWLMANGYSNVRIASRLHVAESTVKGHVESIFARLNVRNRAEAVAVAVRLHLVRADRPSSRG